MFKRLAWSARHGLSKKIAVLVALLIIVSLTTMTMANILRGQMLLEDRTRQRAIDIATLLADALGNYLYDLRADEVDALTAEISTQHDVLYAYVIDSGDMLLTESEGVGYQYDIVDDALSRQARQDQRVLTHVDDVGFHATAPVFLGHEQLGVARVTISRASLNRDLSSLRNQNLLLGLACVVVGLVVSRSFIMRTVRPLRKLTVATKAIAGGELKRAISIQTGDEVQELADAFNQMTASLDAKDVVLSQQISDLALAQERLREANQELEARVAERTQELESALVTAQEATRLRSEFLANMSHEIRTPINGVLGMAELLANSHLEAKQKHFANAILGSAKSLLGTINDILDFSKIEAGRLDLDSAPFDLRVLIEDVVQQLCAIAHQKRLELICDVAPDMPTAFRGDAQRLRQILVNLIGNAIKFTEKGQVAVRVCIPDGTELGEFLFEVSETGIGIAADAKARIFESFAQADGSTSRQFGGTGLGLAISQKIVTLMGGTIGVVSDLGQGATFRFKARFVEEPLPSNAKADDQTFDDLKVLILDDNETNRDILGRQLKAWHVAHGLAADGHTALEILRHARSEGKPYDVVLVDRFMPSIDGFDFAHRVRGDAALSSTKLVLLSSMTADKASDRWHAAAFAYSLAKPLRQSDLYQCLRCLDCGQCLPVPIWGGEKINHGLEGRPSGQVLVAEDNAVNQDLIEAILGHLGCQVTLVGDGEGAIQAFERNQYDLILMDCQMPRVDGYQATRALRDLEKNQRDRDRTPIVALTANAMEGDRKKCLEAGMDDYLAKPFVQADLVALLSRWLPEGMAASRERGCEPAAMTFNLATSAEVETTELIDPDALGRVRQIAGSRGDDLLIEIITRYLDETPMLMNDLTAATEHADYMKIRHLAHSLKSSSANLGASKLSQQCKDVEAACRNDEVDKVKAKVEKIVADYDPVASALRAERNHIHARQAGSSTVFSAPH